jgi:L-asparagine oxygenase
MNSPILELLKEEIEKLQQIALELNNINPLQEPEFFCLKAKELSKKIPFRIQHCLQNFLNSKGNEPGFIIIQTIPFPINTIVKTPNSNIHSIGSSTILARIQAIFLSFLGEIISYEAEGNGNLFQDIIPVKNNGSNQTSYSSDIELEIHTEQAFSKIKPDFLSLACLRGDENALTYLLPLQKIIDNIVEHEYELLLNPLWKIGIDLSFKKENHTFLEGEIRGPLSILNKNSELNSKPTLIFDQDLMNGITEEANILKQKIVDIYYKERISYNLKSGEIILIDNRYTLHGRSKFIPKFDGQDRFLIRCFGILDNNYEKSLYARPNNRRIVNSQYS